MSTHFCAALPNFRVMEIDIDDVPWKDDVLTWKPVIKSGCVQIPNGSGWGGAIKRRCDCRTSTEICDRFMSSVLVAKVLLGCT